nr:tail fiber assembly protein [Escherichia coli]
MIYRNFSHYMPKEAMQNVAYLISEDGDDWYLIRDSLTNPQTLKIAFQADGVIRQQTYDAQGMFPENLSVTEINKEDVPDELPERLDGNWVFDGEKIAPRIIPESELIAQAEETRAQLMSEANQRIIPLQDASDLGIATDEELSQLKAWKTYRVLLSRVDVSKAPDVDWPEKPEE